MVQDNGFQGSHVLNSSNRVVAGLYTTAANTREYFSLKQENDRLAHENAVLRNFLKSNYMITPAEEVRKRDTLYKRQYSYVSAKVVNATVNKRRNFLTINIGSNHGVDHDMGVMSSDGIIGIVTDVSRNFCTAMSVLHKDFGVQCQLKKDRSYGSLVWDGNDYRYCNMIDIPTHAKINKGDTIITSELSGLFPEGIMVGIVESFEKRRNEPYFTAKIKLSSDLKKVNHVYIITNKYKSERDSLEERSQKQFDD